MQGICDSFRTLWNNIYAFVDVWAACVCREVATINTMELEKPMSINKFGNSFQFRWTNEEYIGAFSLQTIRQNGTWIYKLFHNVHIRLSISTPCVRIYFFFQFLCSFISLLRMCSLCVCSFSSTKQTTIESCSTHWKDLYLLEFAGISSSSHVCSLLHTLGILFENVIVSCCRLAFVWSVVHSIACDICITNDSLEMLC